MTDPEIDALAKELYEYARLHQNLLPADAIIALGNMDVRTAKRAAELYLEALAPVVVASGGAGRLTPTHWSKPEAVVFSEELYRNDVPASKVIVEDNSTNLPENIRLSVELLQKAGAGSERLILVTLPFAERRLGALCQKQFPDLDLQITSPNIPYEEYANDTIDREELINLIVGEVDRLDKYPARGFTVSQKTPKEVHDAVNYLIDAGFSKYKVV